MSFWGGDETIYVSSVIYPLGEELDKIPDVVKASVIGSGMRGEPRTPAIKKAIIDGKGIHTKQAFNYARLKYYAGMPVVETSFGAGASWDVDDAAESVLMTLVQEYETVLHAPTPVEVKAVEVRQDSGWETIMWNLIAAKYNYDFFTDEVHTSVFGLPVGSTLEITAIADPDDLHPDQNGWTLTFTKPDTTTVSFDEWYDDDLLVAGQETIEDRIFILMSIDGAPTTAANYKYGDGSATLNLYLKDRATFPHTVFPAIVLKKKKRWIDTSEFYGGSVFSPVDYKAQPAYKTSKVYARRLGLDMKKIIKLVKDNPDQKQIDYCFVQPGTMIASPTLAAAEYHYNFFNRIRLAFPDNKPAFDAWYAKIGSSMSKKEGKRCPSQSIHMYDPDDVKGTMNITIAWRYMTYEEKSGTLSEKYVVECGPKNQVVVDMLSGPKPKNVKYWFTPLYLRKRLTDSTYAEICVVGLWHENYVFKKKTVKSAVWDAFNDPDGDYGSGFLIPLNWESLNTLSSREQLQLAQENTWIVFNCYEVVKERWYQTGIFKVVLIIIAIVVIVLSWGTLAPYVSALYGSLYGGLVALGIGATIAAALAAILTALIIITIVVAVQLIAKEAGEWAAEHWGPVWGAITQVVVTIVLTWGIGQIGGFYYPDIAAAAAPMTAAETVMVGVSYIMSGLSSYTQFAMEQYQLEANRWQEGQEARDLQQRQLEQLWEENFPELKLPAQMWLMPRESMDDFLARTVTGVDTLMYRLTAHIEFLSEMTLTPKYL